MAENPETSLQSPLNRQASPEDVEAGKAQAAEARTAGFEALRRNSSRMNSEGAAGGASDVQLQLEWKDVKFQIGDKTILENITGMVQPGRLTGVLGPSGSGKSTLLNVLSGRQRTDSLGMNFQGDIMTSGVKIDPSQFRSNIAYVMQDDSILGTETPRECLEFSAYMRLPSTVSKEQRTQYVNDLLTSLNLQKCADTLVGSALIKGISGGERKRTSVGVELITNPKLLFLDEPLSGLDSYAAYTLVEALKDLAKAGVPVLCTVHQPSSEIFDMFDDVMFLHDGEVTYYGSVQELPKHFAGLGFPCKSNFNPADHVMFVLQKEPPEAIRRIKDQWNASPLNEMIVASVNESIEKGKGTNAAQLLGSLARAGATVGAFTSMAMLLKREARGTLRNKGILGARLGMSIFLAGLYAWLFAGSGHTGDQDDGLGPCQKARFDGGTCAADFQAHYGTLVSLAIMAMMGSAQPILLSFPNERPVFLREYAAKQYGVVPYFVSKTLVELPVVLAATLITYLIAYWIMRLHGNFLMLVLYTWALGIASSSLALVIGCGVASAQKALQLSPLALIPQMLFSGLFLPVEKIPATLRWVKYLCPLKYSISLLCDVEFNYVRKNIKKCEASPGSTKESCMIALPGDYLRQTLIEAQSVRWDEWGTDLGLLLALLVGFRIISTILLWRKGKYVF